MSIVYPDFAFSPITQGVLFAVNLLVTTISFSWGANIILTIFQKQAPLGRRLQFSVICALFLQILVVYGVAYLNGMAAHRFGSFYIGVFEYITTFINPLSYFALYWLGVRSLQLTKYQSMRLMRMLYAYFVCNQMLLKIGGRFLFPRLHDPRGWNYLRDILAITSGTLLTYALYRVVMYSIRRYRLYMEFPNNLVIPNARTELLKSFATSCAVYGVAMLCVYFPTGTSYEFVYMSVVLLCYLVICVLSEYITIDKIKLDNKDAHIAMLIGSIEEFRGIKHDFHNILQTYSGYLLTEDYAGLKQYHRKMINTTLTSEVNLEIGRRMSEFPAFFSLIRAKLEMAKQENVSFQVSFPGPMPQVDMDPLDFCRVMAILIDNAIEAAKETSIRRVELSCQRKPDGGCLLILSNDIAGPVEPEKLFLPRYTTKPGHMGLGLVQVRDILHRYGNCTFNIVHYVSMFTVYFEIKPMLR